MKYLYKPARQVSVYLCCQYRCLLLCFYDSSIRFWNCSNSVVFHFLHLYVMVVIILQQWIGLGPLHLCFCPKQEYIIPLDYIVVVYVCCSIDFCFCVSTIFLLYFGTFPRVWYFIFDGCDSIATMKRINPTTFMLLSQARIYHPIGLYSGD